MNRIPPYADPEVSKKPRRLLGPVPLILVTVSGLVWLLLSVLQS